MRLRLPFHSSAPAARYFDDAQTPSDRRAAHACKSTTRYRTHFGPNLTAGTSPRGAVIAQSWRGEMASMRAASSRFTRTGVIAGGVGELARVPTGHLPSIRALALDLFTTHGRAQQGTEEGHLLEPLLDPLANLLRWRDAGDELL